VKIDLVVTRHKSLVQYLKEKGLTSQEMAVVEHATEEVVRGKHVCGVLPHNLSSFCKSFTEIPLALPQELRGKELTIKEVRKYAKEPVTYIVRKVVNDILSE
jgi:putative CRISPR-associated protein (TIGR02620 family)